MNLRPLGLALVLAIFPCAGVLAQSTIEAPAGSGQRFQGTIAINPATGQPVSPTGGAGGGGGGSTPVPLASGTGGVTGTTLGTTPVSNFVAAAGSTPRHSINILNQAQQGSGVTVTVCLAGATFNGNAVTPATNAPGCATFGPGGSYSAPASGYVPQDAFNAVASAANTPVTIELH